MGVLRSDRGRLPCGIISGGSLASWEFCPWPVGPMGFFGGHNRAIWLSGNFARGRLAPWKILWRLIGLLGSFGGPRGCWLPQADFAAGKAGQASEPPYRCRTLIQGLRESEVTAMN